MHSGWTPFHPLYENSHFLWFIHQANTTEAFIIYQENVMEHFGTYIKYNFTHSGMIAANFSVMCLGKSEQYAMRGSYVIFNSKVYSTYISMSL